MFDVPTITGENIVLRRIKESDIDDRRVFGRPDEFMYMCGGNRQTNTGILEPEDLQNWYQKHLQCTDDKIAWIIEYNNKCIGGARLHNISKADNNATYAIGIWDVSSFSKGIGTEATKLVLNYAFNILKLHRVDLRVLDYNKRGIRCYEKCGFKKDGVLRENAYIEGEYHSDWVMSILENEYHT